jgi:hypothetical protein
MTDSAMKSVAPMLHGIESRQDEHGGRVFFGVSQFIQLLESTYARPGGRVLKNAPTWPYNTFDNSYRFAAEKLKDTLWKINRVAELFELSRRNVRELEPPSVSQEEIARLQTALTDIPIYLEMLLIYLRIFADCLANLTPYLFGQKGKHITRSSFREQRVWFVKKRATLDCEYAAILKSNTKWFDFLAGDPPQFVGLRDAIIHYRGGIQLMFQPARPDRATRVIAALYSDYNTISSDLVTTLQRLFQDLCLFLDRYVDHFVRSVSSQTKSPIFNVANPQAILFFQYEGELPSAWLYPQIRTQGANDGER